MKKIALLLLMLSPFALASGDVSDTDILARTVNFILFFAIVWYLVATPLKNFFNSRSDSIADELDKVKQKLNESIAKKNEALDKITEAEKFAEELIANAKKENKILNDKIMSQCELDIESMAKQHGVVMEFEQRKMVTEVVEDILGEALEDSSNSFDKESMANVILKKVS